MTDYTTVNARARRIRLVVLDVDGVLPDGSIWTGADGELVKRFYTRDGLGIKMLQSTGIPVAILTGRLSAQTAARAAELGITLVKQGKQFKTDAFRELIAEVGVTPEETAYMGDDVPDIPVLKTAGLAAVPADASDEVKPLAHWQSYTKRRLSGTSSFFATMSGMRRCDETAFARPFYGAARHRSSFRHGARELLLRASG